MPTYEYLCKKCGNKFEIFQRITEKPLKSCPECFGPAQRLIGAGAGFIFKGSGFYATDYRSREYKEKERQEGNSRAEGCPASDGKGRCNQCPANKNAKKN